MFCQNNIETRFQAKNNLEGRSHPTTSMGCYLLIVSNSHNCEHHVIAYLHALTLPLVKISGTAGLEALYPLLDLQSHPLTQLD